MKILKGCVCVGGGGGGSLGGGGGGLKNGGGEGGGGGGGGGGVFVRVFGGFQKWVRSMGGGKIWL